jgi:PAS domain S-box-containing protein
MEFEDDLFRQIIDNLTEVIWMLDADLEAVQYVNPAYESLVGETENIDPLAVIHPLNREEAAEWLAEIEADIEAGTVEKEYPLRVSVTDARGEERWLQTIGVPVYDGGTIVGVAGISSDVTELVERERQLENQVERLDQFASMVSHDLRSPLSVAISNLELYRAHRDDEQLDKLDESLQRIETLVEDLLNLVRGVEEISDTGPVSLASVSEDAWAATETRTATLETEDSTIEADASQLQTLLENLFRNAIGHGGEGVTVRVGGLQDGFFVEDTGKGIPAEQRQQVFEHGHTNSYSGTGVGLTIVQQIASGHGWTVSLAESEEGGVRFDFQFS